MTRFVVDAHRVAIRTAIDENWQEVLRKPDVLKPDIRAYLESIGKPIGPYDILIAAQARQRDAVLVTLNRRGFERVPRLMVTDWSN